MNLKSQLKGLFLLTLCAGLVFTGWHLTQKHFFSEQGAGLQAQGLGYKASWSGTDILLKNKEGSQRKLSVPGATQPERAGKDYWQSTGNEGIQLRYYRKDSGNLGYDVEVAPGAEISAFQLSLDEGWAWLSGEGALILPSGKGHFRHSPPVAYQEIDGERIGVACRFTLQNSKLGFALDAYDEAYPVVIDPEISFHNIAPERPAASTLAAALNGGGSVVVKAVNLSGIVGYPELDELQLCLGADTLAFLVYTTSDVPLTNVGIVMRYGGGIEYGGFVSSDVPGSVVLASAGNPLAPRLTIPTLTQDNPIIVYLGVSTNCSSLSGNYSLKAEFTYAYTDPNTNLTATCKDETSFAANIFQAAALMPILNIRNQPAAANFTSLNQQRCQTLTISQDGIRAKMDSFQITVDSLDLSKLQINSIKVNGQAFTNYTYDAGNQRLTGTVTSNYFLANGSPNPADMFFNENETLTMEFCYSVPACIPGDLPNVIYRVDQLCKGLTCSGVGDEIDAVMQFNPNFGITPIARVTLADEAEVCGNPARLNIKFSSNSTNPTLGLYEDIKLSLNTCDSNFLILQDVLINGMSLPASAIGYNSAGVSFIDFRGLTSDPDGPGGLDDIDGDGFYDDLPGGDTIRMEVLFAVQCPDRLQGCSASSCQINSVRIDGKRYCGRPFAQTATVPNSPLIGYESTSGFTFDLNGPTRDTQGNRIKISK